MIFDLPLETRLRIAKRRNERYATDEEYRLKCVNRERARRGLPLAANVNEIMSRQEASALGVQARRKRRA